MTELPAYEPPHLPLTLATSDTLTLLTRDPKNNLSALISSTTQLLTSAATALIDNTPQSQTPDASLLAQLEAAARSAVDASTAHTTAKSLLLSLAETERQRARRPRDDDDEDLLGHTGADDAFSAVDPADGLWGRFKAGLEQHEEHYAALPPLEKYGGNQEYVDYRRTLWDFQHASTGAPCPPVRTWFGDAGEDSDEDIEVAQERRSFKCPLSLREFEDPLTSTVCPHSFERSAVTEYLTVRGRPAEKECPMPGCGKVLSLRVLKEDRRLLGLMARVKEMERRRRERERLEEAGSEEEEEEVPGTQIKEEGRKKRKGRRMLEISDEEDD